jgi:hypothetical protein
MMKFTVRRKNTCHAITALPEGHPWLQHFTLYVMKFRMDNDNSWVIAEYFSPVPHRYLCKDGMWRYGISDYNTKFGTLDSQEYTDEDFAEAEKLRRQFNADRYYTEEEAIKQATIYAPKMRVNRSGIADALALKYESEDDDE